MSEFMDIDTLQLTQCHNWKLWNEEMNLHDQYLNMFNDVTYLGVVYVLKPTCIEG